MGLAVLLLGTWFAFLLGANDQTNPSGTVPGVGGGPGLNTISPTPTPTVTPSPLPPTSPSEAPLLIIPSPTLSPSPTI